MGQLPMKDAYEGGFENPVFDSQNTFRAIMKAMAEPGLIVFCKKMTMPPNPLLPLTAAAFLTLCDEDVSFYLANESINEAAKNWIKFQTGARLASSLSEAGFIFVDSGRSLLNLEVLAHGTDECPDRSATLIVQTNGFQTGDEFILEGPGIKTRRSLFIEGLPEGFLKAWTKNVQRFPCGVDILFVSSDGFAGLPRSTRIVKKQNIKRNANVCCG